MIKYAKGKGGKGREREKLDGKRDDIMGIIWPGGRAHLSTAKGIIFLSMVPIRCEVYHRRRGGGGRKGEGGWVMGGAMSDANSLESGEE